MQWRGVVAVALVTLLVLAGTAGSAGGAPTIDRGSSDSADVEDDSATAELCEDGPADPETDVIGWEAGCWHNQSIAVDQSDGLSQAERDAYVARAMARVEYLRDREFKTAVPVEVIPRDEYRNQTQNQTSGGNYSAWNNQVWEALFIVGGDDDVQSEIQTVFGSAVVGFYSPEDDEIKIITETPDEPVLDNATLVHELVHALQDQYYNLSESKYQGTTQDQQLAADGLVEGEANHIQTQYVERCGADWDCVATPAQASSGGGGSQPNLGILLTVLNPYSDGPVYVDSLLDQDGWDAIDAEFESPPESTEQIIHRTDEEPTPIEYEDGAQNGWALFPEQGTNGSDTVGEASIFSMFWYQASEYRASTINPNSLFQDLDGQFDTYDYAAEPSAGWGNDRVFPYRNQGPLETNYGYVWVTEWDTVDDAGEFHETYQQILTAHGAEQVGERTWVIDSGPFADSFRVVHSGTRVTIVNGPTVEDLADIRPSIDYQPLRTPTPSPSPTPPSTTAATATAEPDDATPTRTVATTTPGQSGFGMATLWIAIGSLVLWRRWRD